MSVSLQNMQHTEQQESKKQRLCQHCIFPSVWAKNRSVDCSHSTFGISFAVIWSLDSEARGMKCNEGPRSDWRALCLRGVYLPWTQRSHPTTTPPTFTPTQGKNNNCLIKLPQHAPHHSYGIDTTVSILQSHCIVCEPTKWYTNCPLLCPHVPFQCSSPLPVLASPRPLNLMKLSSREIKWLKRTALLVSACEASALARGRGVDGETPWPSPTLSSPCALASRPLK